MTKLEAIMKILELIYTSDTHTIITNKEKTLLNQYCKDNFTKKATYNDFLYGSAEVTGIIAKLQSGRYEIEKQFQSGKGLQSGILVECILAQGLAKLLSLNNCVDLDITPVNLIPAKCIQFIKASAKYISSARYVYYGTSEDKFIVQYGNPEAGDAEIIYLDQHVKLEFKDSTAKAGEYDLQLDESGKLSIPLESMERVEHLQWFVDGFNATNNVFELLGHNDRVLNTTPDMIDSIISYFNKSSVDLFVTTTDDEIVAIRPCDMKEEINGQPIINTSGSEIRTTGRNKSKVFTPMALRRFLLSDGAQIDDDNNVTMPMHPISDPNRRAYGDIQERGKEKGIFKYYKLKYIFCVPLDKATKNVADDTITFNLNDVFEKKPTVSPHMAITANKEELREFYLTKIINSTI